MKRQFGLIGYPLSHSFSGRYFRDKFERENITDAEYKLYEIDSIEKVVDVFNVQNLKGFNVTIPYKHDIQRYLDDLDHSAGKVGAVNVVKIQTNGLRVGFNSDYYGFRTSLEKWLPGDSAFSALILGTGGAAKAVIAVLNDLGIQYLKVSRDTLKGDISYNTLTTDPYIMQKHKLIINTTPLGMSPNTEIMPNIPYQWINEQFYLYDLIYNPEETRFMNEGRKNGAHVKNGYEMLELQAEKSWEIWNY